MVSTANNILSILVILVQIDIAVILIAWAMKYFAKKDNLAIRYAIRWGLPLAFLTALVSTLGSLFYSEIAGYEPCTLCWYQRIVMYPQVITLGLALWKKNEAVVDQSIMLSLIGAMIAVYQYLGQISVIELAPCSAIGYSVSCSKTFVMNYGYITIPMMALTGFSYILLLMLIRKFSK
ncbi:MAG: disulfide bond formation protein B [Candidatus Buchananbacteria bacterium]|nr:disulfide bond formation protein B [Candidatus Buchananbacteria bacterium]